MRKMKLIMKRGLLRGGLICFSAFYNRKLWFSQSFYTFLSIKKEANNVVVTFHLIVGFLFVLAIHE